MFIKDSLYAEIVQSMPIPCVDLVVMDRSGRILLLKRKNEPAANQWWFPGGRVLFGEMRLEAAKRKLVEECGLSAESEPEELATLDCLLSIEGKKPSHGITTLYKVLVGTSSVAAVDQQSYEGRWGYPSEWQAHDLHPMVLAGIARAASRAGESNDE